MRDEVLDQETWSAWIFRRLYRLLSKANGPETPEEAELRIRVENLTDKVASLEEQLQKADSTIRIREMEIVKLTAVCERDRLRVQAEQEIMGRVYGAADRRG